MDLPPVPAPPVPVPAPPVPVPAPPVPVPAPPVHAPPIPRPAPAPAKPATIPSTAVCKSRLFQERVVPSPMFLTPRYKDKLFWCFYIIAEGPISYELIGPNWFSSEKDYKIQTAERLPLVKDSIKSMKLRRSEMETELVTQAQIGLNGLHALCLLHNVAMTVVMGRKYIDIQPLHAHVKATDKKGIIVVNPHGEYTLRHDPDGSFLEDVHANYWQVESKTVKNGLKSLSAYTLSQLQDICRRLLIPIHDVEGKTKTKPILYQTILSKIE